MKVLEFFVVCIIPADIRVIVKSKANAWFNQWIVTILSSQVLMRWSLHSWWQIIWSESRKIWQSQDGRVTLSLYQTYSTGHFCCARLIQSKIRLFLMDGFEAKWQVLGAAVGSKLWVPTSLLHLLLFYCIPLQQIVMAVKAIVTVVWLPSAQLHHCRNLQCKITCTSFFLCTGYSAGERTSACYTLQAIYGVHVDKGRAGQKGVGKSIGLSYPTCYGIGNNRGQETEEEGRWAV